MKPPRISIQIAVIVLNFIENILKKTSHDANLLTSKFL
nr:MAG TPA: hypothetical protein [Caudoviricetes sp.]